MAFCEDTTWMIDVKKDGTTTTLGRLSFQLTIQNGVISGPVFLTPDVIHPLSQVSGSCQSITSNPDRDLMEVMFTWGTVVVFMAGVAQGTFGSGTFSGRFRAIRLGALAVPTTDAILAGPGDGDTGIGIGNQT